MVNPLLNKKKIKYYFKGAQNFVLVVLIHTLKCPSQFSILFQRGHFKQQFCNFSLFEKKSYNFYMHLGVLLQ